ncbi:MAG: 30S ribosomal protein S2 [Candidatus Aenigmarchaeota archaeon]|nr:30S ribosomal protein S2 [Candidatus Aenigmarchaeota archaeon]
MTTKLLMSQEEYLASGVHIGMKQKAEQMKPFIYKVREDGLAVMNLGKIDERIKTAAKFLSSLEKILVVTRKSIAFSSIKKFGEAIGAEVVTGRFMPGTLTNPTYKSFFEAQAVVIVDPVSDHQAMEEAVKARVPVVAICDTFNETKDIDLIIPANNKGRKSVATIFWLLAREIMKERGGIKSDKDFKYEIKDFEGTEASQLG